MYYKSRSGGTLLHRPADASHSLTRWRHFSVSNDVMAAILKLWRQIENLTPSVDAYLLGERSYQSSSRSDLKRWKKIMMSIDKFLIKQYSLYHICAYSSHIKMQ